MKHHSVVLALLAAYVRAQELNQIIVGCIKLDCPPSSIDSANDDCTVAGNSFPYVGLTRIFTRRNDPKGKVTWTKSFNITDTPENDWTFHSAFYLDTSPDLDLSDTGACAELLHGAAAALYFDAVNGNKDTSQGTRYDTMGSGYATVLLDRAKKLLENFGDDIPSSQEAWAKLQDDLDKNMDEECLFISKGSWTNLTTTVLSGERTPQPLSTDKDSSSTCWPVLPKENKLTLASEYQTKGSLQTNEAQAAMYTITPFFNIYFSTGN